MNPNKRNHGYGRRIDYAGRQILRERYGGGHDATRRTHAERWGRLTIELRRRYGIRDMRDITPNLLQSLAAKRLDDGYAPRTIANEISTANAILGHARHGAWAAIRPARITGTRDAVRYTAPASLAPARDHAARKALTDTPRAAAVYILAHSAGLRSREASLADLDRLTREADRYGAINIQEGTKGGRCAPRWLPVTSAIRRALATARAARPAGSRNLCAPTRPIRTGAMVNSVPAARP